MSKRSKNVSKNLILALISRIAYLVIGFLSRRLIIQFISVEYLGLSSLYANMLDFLNLAELGIGVAIQIRLYEPLVNDDRNKIFNLVQIAQKIYSVIGLIVLLIGVCSSFLLQFLIKDNPFPLWYVITAYLISVVGIAFSYFCASKRLYFESNEKYYVITLSDLLSKVLFTAIGLIILYFTREYLYYCGTIAIQATVSNFALAVCFRKKHPELCGLLKDKGYQKTESNIIKRSMLDVIPMKLGVYIFSSTDSIVITSFIGLTASAIYANYNLISLSLLSISTSVSSALVSTFGKLEKEDADKTKMLNAYKIYENVQYMFSIFTAVCLLLLYDKFMIAWMGEELLIGRICVLLLSLDYLVHSGFQPLSTLYTSTGKFKEDKVCSLIAAGINIGLSVLLVYFIGLPGVIIGTLVANIFTFIIRNYIINKKYFQRSNMAVMLKPLFVVLLFVFEVILCYFATAYIQIENAWAKFFVCAIICIAITNVINLIWAYILGYGKFIKRKLNLKDMKVIISLKNMFRPIYHKMQDLNATRWIKKNIVSASQDKIRIVFICQVQHIWNKMLPVVDVLSQDSSFEVCLLHVEDSKEDSYNDNVFQTYAREKSICYIEYRQNILKDMKPDYVVYPRPYDVWLPKDIQSCKAVRYARLVYIPYGYSTMKLGEVNLSAPFIRNIALFFADMEYSFLYFSEARKRNLEKGLQKSYNIGYPFLEYLCAHIGESYVNSAFYNRTEMGKTKILWTPRWTSESRLGGSNFLRYIDSMFDEFIANNDCVFVFRPHPYAFSNFVDQGILTNEQKEAYIQRINVSENAVYDFDDDYMHTLFDADIAIMDISSIVPERVLTGKPIIFCHNENDEVLNEKMIEMTKIMYNAYCFDDIKRFARDIINGHDPLKQERQKYCLELRKEMIGTCERIKTAILEDCSVR